MSEQKEKELYTNSEEWQKALALIIEEEGGKDFPFLNVFTNLTVLLHELMPILFINLMTTDNQENKRLFGGAIALLKNIREKIEQSKKETIQ